MGSGELGHRASDYAETSRRVGATLRELRRSARIPVERLSVDSGIGVSSIGQYERGERTMSLDAFWRYCSALGKDPVEVLNLLGSVAA